MVESVHFGGRRMSILLRPDDHGPEDALRVLFGLRWRVRYDKTGESHELPSGTWLQFRRRPPRDD